MKTLFMPWQGAALATILCITSCALPQPVPRLTTLADQYEWFYGQQHVKLPAQNGVSVELAFRQSTPENLMFDFTIKNQSTQTILVDPVHFALEPVGQDKVSPVGPLVSALDPEKVLLNLDRAESREIAESQNATSVELLSATMDVASDISSINNPKDPEAEAAEEVDRDNRRASYESTEAQREILLNSMDEQREFWANQAIRKTSLKPNHEMSGLVMFPRVDKANFLNVRAYLADLTFKALYKQRLYSATNSN